MTLEEIQAKLGQLGELPLDELEQLHLAVVGELASFEEGPEKGTTGYAAAVGRLSALQIAAEKVGFAIERGRTAASAQSVVTASGANGRTSAASRMAARSPRPRMSPEAQAPTGSSVMKAMVASGRFGSGDVLDSREKLAEFLAEVINSGKHGVCASAFWDYPEERQLTSADAWENTRKLEAVTSPQALVATGGVCLPVNVDYAVPTWVTPERPIRDALPAFQANRGGLRYVQAPDIGSWLSASGIWTAATDASPGAATKPVVTMACGAEQLVYLQAVSTRWGFGNMQGRFAPEQIAAAMDLGMAGQARVAEQSLLNLIASACVQTVTTPAASTGLGATRDLISALAEGEAGFRDSHRLGNETVLTAILPRWVRGLIRADLARQIGVAETDTLNHLAVTDEQIDQLFEPFNIRPIWHLDGQTTSAPGLGSSVSQSFPIQGTGSILKFPTQVVWYLFPEGAMQYLDGGRLDLGVVRDSTLDATNDYEVFNEQLESVAFRGFSSGAIQYISTISATGASTGTVTTPPAA